MKSLLIYLNLYYYISSYGVRSQTTQTVHQSSGFTCKNGRTIDFIDVCDGISDCEDGSDERCENQAILFYSTLEVRVEFPERRCQDYYNLFKRIHPHHSLDSFFDQRYSCKPQKESMREILNITGIFLNDNTRKEFALDVRHDSLSISILEYRTTLEIQGISFNGPKIDIFYVERTSWYPPNYKTFVGRRMVTSHNASSFILISTTERIKNPVVDWITSNTYYISGSQIRICNQNLTMCVNLQSKFVKDPVFLTISVDNRLLFWIDRKSPQQYNLYKYSLTKRSKPTLLIRQDLKAPKWLAIDSTKNRVYWLDDRDDEWKFYSSTFEGMDLKILSPGGSNLFNISSFAVFGDIVYWPNTTWKNIMKCSVHDCDVPTTFKNISVENDLLSINHLYVDHRSVTPDKIKDPCNRSRCSHMCLAVSKTSYDCYCERSNKPLFFNDMNSVYCPDDTLIAAYQNSLYVVGLLGLYKNTPFIQKNTINISCISTIVYNSIDGSVILTEMEKQRIYSWKPKTEELELILDAGLGTINSMEFDDHANNLYWIDPGIHTIKVMDMNSRVCVSILVGNSSYSPVNFALVPSVGFMFVLFVKENSVAVVERISMNGRPDSRKSLLVDDEIDEIENLTIHYMKEYNIIFLVDRQIDEIKYFSVEKSDLLKVVSTKKMGNIESITGLGYYVIWSDDDFTINTAYSDSIIIRADQKYRIPFEVNKIKLDLKASDSGRSSLKITNVFNQTVAPDTGKCLQNNGGCEKLCLSSSGHLKFTCLCPEGETLVNGTSCKKLSSFDSVTIQESQMNKSETNSETLLDIATPKSSTMSKADAEITTPLQQTESITFITQLANGKSCPVCQNPQPQNSLSLKQKLQESSLSSSITILYEVFIYIVAVILGVGTGYYISRARSLPKIRKIRLFSSSGTLELSHLEPGDESTSTLPRTEIYD